jgi:IS605 OrfB family transposase
MNPNYIGFVIKDYESNQILYKEIISLKSLNDKFNLIKSDSSDSRKVKLNNIRRNLVFEISKKLINTVNHFQCESFVLEKLEMGNQNHNLGRRFNKLINNQWLRTILISNLEKRCNLNKIKFTEVYPQYSSFIGCMMHPNEIDSIAAAIELNRRGYELINYNKNNSGSVMYPKFDVNQLRNLWKDRLTDLDFGCDWRQFYTKIKESKLRYRLLLDDAKDKVDAVFKVFNIKNYITLYDFLL